LDRQGQVVIKPQFDDLDSFYSFSEGLAAVEKNGKWGFVDKEGVWVISPRFKSADAFKEGLAPAQVGDQWGYIDISGKWVIEALYEWADVFKEGEGTVYVGGSRSPVFIDRSGKKLRDVYPNMAKLSEQEFQFWDAIHKPDIERINPLWSITYGTDVAWLLLVLEVAWLLPVAYYLIDLFQRNRGNSMKVIPLVVSIALFPAHFAGYKIFGSPQIVDNRPLLDYPLVLDRLEMPNILVAVDGSRHSVKGVTFKPEVVDLPTDLQHQKISHFGEPLLFQPSDDSKSGYVAQYRIWYSCGNTPLPWFFRGPISTHCTDGMELVLSNASEPVRPNANRQEP